MKIANGDVVILVLREPKERILGIVEDISDAGVFIRGIDLGYFDEWTAAIKNRETYLPMQEIFYPMWRVERVTKDGPAAGVPSMADQFEHRTGMRLSDF